MAQESNTMQALYIVIQHIGTENRRKLKELIHISQDLEYATKVKNYQENMNAWSLAHVDTLGIVHKLLLQLEQDKIDPFNANSEYHGANVGDFLNKFTNQVQMKYGFQMMATRGYTVVVHPDGLVTLYLSIDDEEFPHCQIFIATPNPQLTLPIVYPYLL